MRRVQVKGKLRGVDFLLKIDGEIGACNLVSEDRFRKFIKRATVPDEFKRANSVKEWKLRFHPQLLNQKRLKRRRIFK